MTRMGWHTETGCTRTGMHAVQLHARFKFNLKVFIYLHRGCFYLSVHAHCTIQGTVYTNAHVHTHTHTYTDQGECKIAWVECAKGSDHASQERDEQPSSGQEDTGGCTVNFITVNVTKICAHMLARKFPLLVQNTRVCISSN